MYSVLIEGFKTAAQAKTFIEWYENQGEQDITVWLECRKDEGEIDIKYMGVDCAKTYPIEFDENGQAKMVLFI